MKTDISKSIGAMRTSIAHLADTRPIIYWVDLATTSFFSWGLFCLAIWFSDVVLFHGLLVCLSAIGLYRAAVFTHELVHLKEGVATGFFLFWHMVCGIPLLAPHFLYRAIHQSHHSKKNYGKVTDGEYIDFVKSRKLIVCHFLFNLIIPLSSILRFMLIAPLSLLHPSLRGVVMEKMSFMGPRFTHSRKVPTKKAELIQWHVAEFTCCFLCWFVFALIITQKLPIAIFFQWYAVMCIILTLNSLRSLGAAHWYASEGSDLSFDDQIRDSISITSNSLFTKILCPVGTQYHAIHHMFPFVPYHAQRKVYEHLRKNFPEEKILTETTRSSMFVVWKELWRLSGKKKIPTNLRRQEEEFIANTEAFANE